MALLTGTVTGRFEDTVPGATEPVSGTVFFTAEAEYLLSDDSIVLPVPVAAQVVNGEFSVELVATDEPTLSPINWTYRVEFNISANGSRVNREAYSIKVLGGTITNLRDVTPVSSSSGTALPRQTTLSVGTVNTLTQPGLWLQTGLGDGTGYTLWIEDGL